MLFISIENILFRLESQQQLVHPIGDPRTDRGQIGRRDAILSTYPRGRTRARGHTGETIQHRHSEATFAAGAAEIEHCDHSV